MNSIKTARSRFTLAGAASILLWSTTISFSRALTEQLGTLTAAAWIYLLAGILGLAAAETMQRGSIQRMARLPLRYLFGCGALFVLYITCLYLGVGLSIDRYQVLAVGLINYLWPALSLAFSIPLLHHRARAWLPLGILIGLAGTALSMTAGDDVLTGLWISNSALPYLLALVAAVSWALYSNLSRRWGSPVEGGAVPLFLLASGLLLLALRIFSPEVTRWSLPSALELAYMALFPAMLAYVLWDLAMRRGDMILVASLSYLTPLLSTLISALVLNVRPAPIFCIGALLVMGGAIVCKASVKE